VRLHERVAEPLHLSPSCQQRLPIRRALSRDLRACAPQQLVSSDNVSAQRISLCRSRRALSLSLCTRAPQLLVARSYVRTQSIHLRCDSGRSGVRTRAGGFGCTAPLAFVVVASGCSGSLKLSTQQLVLVCQAGRLRATGHVVLRRSFCLSAKLCR
jgi:hypothetical protein